MSAWTDPYYDLLGQPHSKVKHVHHRNDVLCTNYRLKMIE